MLRTHVLICSCMLLLTLPIWWLDAHTLKSGGRDWIALDFRGLLVKSYLAFVLLHIGLSTIALRFFGGSHLAMIHVGSAVCAISLIGAGLFVYDRMQRTTDQRGSEARLEQRKTHAHEIELKSWSYVPDEAHATEIHVQLIIAAPGRFSGNMDGADGEEQRMVRANEHLTYVFKLTGPHAPSSSGIAFTFYLLKGPIGSTTPDDVAKVFMRRPATEDDGSYFYGTLPLNSPNL